METEGSEMIKGDIENTNEDMAETKEGVTGERTKPTAIGQRKC